MKTLFILRHAKSSWSDPDLADFDRPLNSRGERDAPLMGKQMANRGLIPELVLSSPAARARRTAELASKAAAFDGPLNFVDRIYEASPQTLLSVIKEVSGDKNSLMIVGHNPGVVGLIRLLTDRNKEMPTASLAVIELEVDRWPDVTPGTGRLIEVLRPKDIRHGRT